MINRIVIWYKFKLKYYQHMMKTKWYIGALAALLVACKAPTLQEEAAGKYGKFTVRNALKLTAW